MTLTRLAVHRPVTTLMIGLVVTLLGYVAVDRLAVDLLPKLDYPMVSVETLYRGAAPEEIETLLTRPLEQALSSVKGSEDISSVSSEGASTIRVRMTWGADLDVALNDMRQAVQKVRQQLPDAVEGPYFRRYDEGDSPIIYLALERKNGVVENERLAVEITRRAEIEIEDGRLEVARKILVEHLGVETPKGDLDAPSLRDLCQEAESRLGR